MRVVALVLMVAISLQASPSTTTDGVFGCTAPQFGEPVVPLQGQVWMAYANDNRGGGDLDCNDAIVRLNFNTATTFDMNWIAGLSAMPQSVGVLGQPGLVNAVFSSAVFAYTPGVEVVLKDIVLGGGVWFSGTHSNSDQTPHFWVECVEGCSAPPDTQTPEPSTFFAIGAGLLAIRYLHGAGSNPARLNRR